MWHSANATVKLLRSVDGKSIIGGIIHVPQIRAYSWIAFVALHTRGDFYSEDEARMWVETYGRELGHVFPALPGAA